MSCEYCDGDGGAYTQTKEGVSVHYHIRSGYSDFYGNKVTTEDMEWEDCEDCGGTGLSEEEWDDDL